MNDITLPDPKNTHKITVEFGDFSDTEKSESLNNVVRVGSQVLVAYIAVGNDGTQRSEIYGSYQDNMDVDQTGILLWIWHIAKLGINKPGNPITKGLLEGIAIHLDIYLSRLFRNKKQPPNKHNDN